MSSVCFLLSPTDVACDNEVNAIQNLLECSRSSAYSKQRKASTKCGHLIAQVHNIGVKWFIKPCIVRTKKPARH